MLCPDCLELISSLDILDESFVSIILFGCGFVSGGVSKLREKFQKRYEAIKNIDWKSASAFMDFSEKFIEKNQDKIDWYILCSNPNITNEFLLLHHVLVENSYNERCYYNSHIDITSETIDLVRNSINEFTPFKVSQKNNDNMLNFVSYLRTPKEETTKLSNIMANSVSFPCNDLLNCVNAIEDIIDNCVSCILFDAIMNDDIDVRFASKVPKLKIRLFEFKIYLHANRYEVMDDEFYDRPNMDIMKPENEDDLFRQTCIDDLYVIRNIEIMRPDNLLKQTRIGAIFGAIFGALSRFLRWVGYN